MVRDFYLRFVAVLFSAFGFSFLLVLFAMSPSYFLANFQEKLINDSLAKQQNEPVPAASQQALEITRVLDQKLAILDKAKQEKFIVSEKIFNVLVLYKMPDIKITQIFYENTAAGEKKVLIRGSAPSRERLLLFRLALEDSLSFQKVDLPISNFVKGANIEFSINLIP